MYVVEGQGDGKTGESQPGNDGLRHRVTSSKGASESDRSLSPLDELAKSTLPPAVQPTGMTDDLADKL